MFSSARLKLTAWYLVIILAVSVMFSFIIYRVLMGEVLRFEEAQRYRLERTLFPGVGSLYQASPEMSAALDQFVNETRARILLMLIEVNVGVIVISGGLGYMLAGRTLMPIQSMVNEQNRFIGDASHEFRTPLTSLKSAFEVYLRAEKPTLMEAKMVMQESIEEVNKLQGLSESLLQLARFQKPYDSSIYKTVSIEEIIERAVKKISVVAGRKDIRISQDIKDFSCQVNEQGLQDVVVILLDNAVKYSPEGSEVKISVKKKDHDAVISVSDQGIGIKKSDMSKIFDRFYRADTARTRIDSGGYGLGLSIAKKIVEDHQGSITVSSKVGSGSTFTVHLPVKRHYS